MRTPGAESDDGGFRSRALLVVVPAQLAAITIGYALAASRGIHDSASALALAGAPLAGALLIATRGHHTAAARLALGTTLVLVARLMYVGDGTADVVVIAWPALVLAAGLLLRRRDFHLYVAGVVGACVWVALQAARGRLPHPNPRPDHALLDLGVLVVVAVVTAIAVDILIHNLRRSLSEALDTTRELRASEERFNRAFHASPAAMAITRLEDRVMLDLNRAFLRATGTSREQILGQPSTDSGLWVDLAERDELYRSLEAAGGFSERLVRFRRSQGDVGQALVSGGLVEIAGEQCALFTCVDVTDRVRAEEALAASEERYRLISRLISDYTFSTRLLEDGTMQLEWVAGAFEQISGYSFEEYVARGGWRAALHPDDLPIDDRALEAIARRETVQLDVRTRVPGGEERWVRVYGHPAWDEKRDRLAGIHGAVKDITDQKRAELEREALIGELEAKNTELERFTYTVSHDLKSPLLTIRGFLGHVRNAIDRGDATAATADLERIREAATRMGRLLDELLELSRIGRIASPPVDVAMAELANEAIGLCRGRLEPRDAEVHVQPELPVLHGDRSRLLEVLQNLIDNAVKFTPPERQPRVEIGARREPGRTVLFVADQGIGVEPAHQEQIFGLFDKLDPTSEGTGIGLALVQRIVQLYGGEIWVESEGAGRGSRFCFTLPGAATA